MSVTVLKNAEIVLWDQVVPGASVVIDEGQIVYLVCGFGLFIDKYYLKLYQ